MSKGTLDRNTFETIEAYVLDRMSSKERASFEERMAADAELRREVDLQRDHIHAVELGGFLRTLQQVGRAQAAPTGGGHWTKLWRYAAMVAVVVAAAVWWLTRPTSNEQLFTEHFRPDPGLPVVMGATDDPAFADAMVSYKEGKYAEARAKWSPLLQAEPMNDTLRYYMASAWLGEHRSQEALPLLESVAADEGSVFQGRARWSLFLARIHNGETSAAMAMPLDDDTVYGERVRRIKQRLSP